MKIAQKKHGTNIEYDFKDDSLHYKIKDGSGSNSYIIHYEDITNNITEFEERNKWYKDVGSIWVVVGLLGITLGAQMFFWLVLGIICYGLYYYYFISYSKIDAIYYNLLIIKDKEHNKVMKEIFNHRNAYLKAKYGKINEKNDKQNELDKFKWLKNLGAISEKELADFEKTIENGNSQQEQFSGFRDKEKTVKANSTNAITK